MADQNEPVGLAGPELLLAELRREPGTAALHEQLEQALRDQIRRGRLPANARLPSSRALAAELGISRGVVLEAYSQLAAEGYLIASQGAPTRVAAAASAERPPMPAASLGATYQYSFDPGLPDLSSFPRTRWLRALRSVLRTAPFTALGPGDVRGSAELRNELMGYLGRVRGAAPEPEHTLISAGPLHGLAVLCRALRARGVERVAIEDPGTPVHRVVAEAAGLAVVPVPVDSRGIVVSELVDCGCEVAIVSPAHQYPTGVVLAPERRAALLAWAEEEDALVVEDDYDSELRYDRMAVGALQGLAPERVCQLGSTALRLAPAIAIGWLLSPSWLTGALTFELGAAGGGPPALEQLALAEFMAQGDLDRHLRRTRLRYRARRATLIEALARSIPALHPVGVAAGVHVLVLLPEQIDEASVITAAGRRGVALEGLDACRSAARPGQPGLVLGFGNLAEPAIERAVALLAGEMVPGG